MPAVLDTTPAFILATEVWVPGPSGDVLLRTDGLYGPLKPFEAVAEEHGFARGEGLPGRAWKEGHPILLANLADLAFLRAGAAGEAGLAAAAAVPVFSGATLKGVLVLFCGKGDAHVGAIEIWRGEGERMVLDAGFYGAADAFADVSKATTFGRGQGLPGGVWGAGAPILMRDLGSSAGFVRSAAASAAGLATGLGLPVASPSGIPYVLTFLSGRATPIARRFEVWGVAPARAGRSAQAILADGLCDVEGPLWSADRASRPGDAPAGRIVLPWQGPVGRALATGAPVAEFHARRAGPLRRNGGPPATRSWRGGAHRRLVLLMPKDSTALERLVVIGAGMASGRALEHLFEADPDRYAVTLFNAEPRGNYNRLMLSPVLSGEKTYEEIVTHDDDWYAANAVETRFGEAVTKIDRERRVVVSKAGATPYDKLLIATGSFPFILPVPGKDLEGVIAFRDIDDVGKMLDTAVINGARAVVIGGGLLGLEAAAGLRLRGMEVVVLHVMGHLMDRQLDPSAAYLLQKDLERRGIKVHCKANTKAIIGQNRVEAVLLDDGTLYDADIVLMAVGIRPETRLAKDAGIEIARGIVVDDAMRTSDPAILSIGECVEHRGALYGLVAPLYDQAKVAAQTLLGTDAAFEPVELSTKLKVTGCDLFSAGDFADGEGREEIVFRDATRGVYKRLVIQDGVLIGAVLYGDTADGAYFFAKIKSRESIESERETLIFGPAYAGGTALDPMAAVAALPDEAEICGCNGVCKGKIVKAITDGGLTTLDEVRSVTKASSSCGQCTGLVEQVLAVTLGDAFVLPAAKPMCKCTDLTHEDVRRLIRAKALKSMPAVWQELGWKTSCGCPSCRPALNFYLLADWPDDYVDDGQSRFINERAHANIQKDGTFSVVPRMWGGVTTPQELRAIADAAEKYDVPMVKVTGGQRLDLLGVRKEDLPAMWADLNAAGLVSGHAYTKGLRTVKTCVGTDFCRFGTQDSTGLGIRLEKRLWGSWTPHKVKMAVSGCPRNCAEATCKDVGVVCTDAGFNIGVGGAAGLDLKATQSLTTAKTEDEAMDITVAFVQLYRENAKYLDRPYKWIEKVGLDWIRAQVVDDAENRAALVARFDHSQTIYQRDPWADRTEGTGKAEFTPLADFSLRAAE